MLAGKWKASPSSRSNSSPSAGMSCSTGLRSMQGKLHGCRPLLAFIYVHTIKHAYYGTTGGKNVRMEKGGKMEIQQWENTENHLSDWSFLFKAWNLNVYSRNNDEFPRTECSGYRLAMRNAKNPLLSILWQWETFRLSKFKFTIHTYD